VSRLPVHARAVNGEWIRHVPHGVDLLRRADTPADGRWQHGETVPALYLADTIETATAEWYRALAEWGLYPQDHVPYDHHRWRIDLPASDRGSIADLSDAERLHALALDPPKPSRQTWPPYQNVGEQLWREGWAGLIAPSAARPGSLVVCVFADAWPPPGCTPLDASTVQTTPPPPRGMTT
jgi:RES domain-containing protein